MLLKLLVVVVLSVLSSISASASAAASVGSLITAAPPVLLTLQSYSNSNNNRNSNSSSNNSSSSSSSSRASLELIRTKPLLFQRVLKLRPGTLFQFRLDQWRALQSCGLYKNLTAHTSLVGSNEVQLVVSGIEQPSITFAPELSFGASLANPNIAGGVLFRNSNFRGVGEAIEVIVAKKEGLDKQLQDLGTTWKMKWTDCSIGSQSKIQLKFEKDNHIDYLGNFNLNSVIPLQKIGFAVSKLTCVLQSSAVKSLNIRKMLSFEPYLSNVEGVANSSTILLSGIKARIEVNSVQGTTSGSLSIDCGKKILVDDVRTNEGYLMLGGSAVTSAPIRRFGSKLRGIVSGSFFKSFGTGTLPFSHFQSLTNPKLIRCARVASMDSLNSVASAASIKTDIYANAEVFGNSVKNGIFFDICGYEDYPSSTIKVAATTGFSLRSHGLCVEVGCPIRSLNSPRFHIGVDLGI